MNDHVAVVHEDPARPGCPFDVERVFPRMFKCLFYFIGNGGKLALAFTAKDDKVIGKTADAAGVEEQDVNCQLFTGGFDGFVSNINRFQNFHLLT